MTNYDRQTFFTALAFIAVILKDGERLLQGSSEKIMVLAQLLKGFCEENIPQDKSPETVVNGGNTAEIDAIILMHREELRTAETTVLPEDRETLLKLYDRLLQRKARRDQQAFYAEATEEQLANLVLKYIDEEIENTLAI